MIGKRKRGHRSSDYLQTLQSVPDVSLTMRRLRAGLSQPLLAAMNTLVLAFAIASERVSRKTLTGSLSF